MNNFYLQLVKFLRSQLFLKKEKQSLSRAQNAKLVVNSNPVISLIIIIIVLVITSATGMT